MPAAIDSYWYPGEKSGYEFAYPREQARLLARGTGRSVLTSVEPFTPAAPPAELSRISPTGEVTPAEPAFEATGPTEIGEVAPPSIEIVPVAQEALPETGSSIPLVAFGGLSLLLGGALSAAFRRARG
jgi:LPXTG-motif cell wall-anchored protein